MKIKPESLKQMAALLFGAVALAAYLTHTLTTRSPQSDQVAVNASVHSEIAQVFLLDKELTLIPYTISIDEGLTLEEKITKVLQYMVVGKEPVQGVNGLFSTETIIEKCILDKNQVSLYFNKAIQNYEPKKEMRILEGITWAATQFEGIDEAVIYVDGQLCTHMPQLSTPIPMPLNRQIGINNFENTVNQLHNSFALIVFYTKNIENQTIYIPKTIRTNKEPSLEGKIEAILDDVSVFSQLNQPLYQSGLTLVSAQLEEKKLILEITGSILDEEKKINENLAKSLVLSLAINLEVDEVELKLDGIPVNLNGVNDDPISVDSILINQI